MSVVTYKRKTNSNTSGKCLGCGAPVARFASSGLFRKYCGKECQDRVCDARKNDKRAKAREHLNKCECPSCDNVKNDGSKYCVKHSRAYQHKITFCVMCYKPFVRGVSSWRQRNLQKREGRKVTSGRCCSRECGFKYQALVKSGYDPRSIVDKRYKDSVYKSVGGGNNMNHKNRCKINGTNYDGSVTLKKLLERDNHRCQECGCKVKRYREYHPRRATIGHIIPISKGGNHSWENCHVECHECNTKKGAKASGQLRLPI